MDRQTSDTEGRLRQRQVLFRSTFCSECRSSSTRDAVVAGKLAVTENRPNVQPFWDPEADAALMAALKQELRSDIPLVELDVRLAEITTDPVVGNSYFRTPGLAMVLAYSGSVSIRRPAIGKRTS